MIAPTSGSSRFSARPVTPAPKSSISFSITSPSPSIRATPSPISRIVPTVCFAVAAFALLIWDSISNTRFDMSFTSHAVRKAGPAPACLLEPRCQSVQPGAHAAVVDVAADLDSDAADQAGILRERSRDIGAVGVGDVAAQRLAHRLVQRRGALDQS